MKNTIQLCLLAGMLALCSAPVSAAELLLVNVDRVDGVYHLESEVWFDAPIDPVYEVFADWDIAVEFSSFIVESRDIGPDDDGKLGYYIRNRGCILFFCQSAVRSGTVVSNPSYELRAMADPALSDFEVSDEVWTFRKQDNGTVVRYELQMKPKFFIPPVIGPYMMKRKLKAGSGDAIQRIERIAQEWTASNE